MDEPLKIIRYPDPRLRRVAARVTEFNGELRELAQRMLEMMREAKGVGLAAPQVAKGIQLFVMNHTGQPEDDRVYVNPVLSEAAGEEEAEEGCLSIPGLHAQIARSKTVRLQARDLEGREIDQVESGYLARIWQHETDHLNGTLITDRMGPTAKMTNKKLLKELEEEYQAMNPALVPSKKKLGSRR